jgi:hypothetical protein
MINWNRPLTAVCTVLLALNAHSSEAELASAQAQPKVRAQAAFMHALQPYCGQAYAAQIVQDSAPSPAWDHPLVVHIRDCEQSVIRMPLHVGDDRSRTWVLTQHSEHIDFQHIHLHEDGSPDAVSPYGGQTVEEGSATRQSFPADEASKALFIANGLDVSVNNTWTIFLSGDLPDSQMMHYQLSRPGRLFEVQVDLSQPVPLPPPAWGYIQP